MAKVLGIDSSTQSCKALLVDAETGEILAQQRALHPAGTEVDPQVWIEAMEKATDGLLEQADAVAIGGQQHGMVALDVQGNPVRPALLWNDTRSAQAAEDLIAELGGPQACADLTGSVHVASITATKLRWMRDHEPEHAAATHSVLLPHDFLTWHLGGRKEMTTDHGDASGTGYYSPSERRWLPELAESALGHPVHLPRLAEPWEAVGRTAHGAIIGPGTGDNAAAALGLDLQDGDVSLSIGTSGVAATPVKHSIHDATGMVNGFADATGAYLPLACTLNGARVLDVVRNLLGVTWEEFDELALSAEPGAHGLTMLPYFDGERTPNRPDATGILAGLTTATSRADFARATVEGILSSMRDAVIALEAATKSKTKRILLIGGAAQSKAVQKIAPTLFDIPVFLPNPGEYVALGAARQAARVLGYAPKWDVPGTMLPAGEITTHALSAYAWLRESTEPSRFGVPHAHGEFRSAHHR